ncbi:MAG: heme A synthase [Bacteriovoracia bacterium]
MLISSSQTLIVNPLLGKSITAICFFLIVFEAGFLAYLIAGSTKKKPKNLLLSRMSLALCILVFFLISLGGLVRNAGAGLSCPDWPLCFGRVVPPMDFRVFLEWFHRLIAGGISLLLLGISFFVFSNKALRKQYGLHCGLAVLLLAAQIVLGGLTVLGLLSSKWVVSHLAFGLAFFSTILYLAMRFQQEKVSNPSSKIRGDLTIATSVGALVYFQAILGGLVSSNYAGLACPDFPTCFGQWIPEFSGVSGSIVLQMVHRAGALITTLSVVSFVIYIWRRFKATKIKVILGVVCFLLIAQLCLGIGSVLWGLPLPMSVAHLGTATTMMALFWMVAYEIRCS